MLLIMKTKNNPLAEQIKELLLEQHLTLAIAESVTCGHLQSLFAGIADTGKFFQGGITVYNLGQKVRHLHIEPIHAELYNCVSETVASEMALNVTELFSASVGISITGYATPMLEKDIYTRFAHFAVVRNGKLLLCDTIRTRKRNATEVQKDYCEQVLQKVLDVLSQ